MGLSAGLKGRFCVTCECTESEHVSVAPSLAGLFPSSNRLPRGTELLRHDWPEPAANHGPTSSRTPLPIAERTPRPRFPSLVPASPRPFRTLRHRDELRGFPLAAPFSRLRLLERSDSGSGRRVGNIVASRGGEFCGPRGLDPAAVWGRRRGMGRRQMLWVAAPLRLSLAFVCV